MIVYLRAPPLFAQTVSDLDSLQVLAKEMYFPFFYNCCNANVCVWLNGYTAPNRAHDYDIRITEREGCYWVHMIAEEDKTYDGIDLDVMKDYGFGVVPNGTVVYCSSMPQCTTEQPLNPVAVSFSNDIFTSKTTRS